MSVEFDIHAVINKLSEVRHAFVSEGDFQFELMKAISSEYPDAIVTAEYCYPYKYYEKKKQGCVDSSNHTDIIVDLDNKIYPIELKYKIIGFDITKEDFDKREAHLPSSVAHNSNCHAFFFDVYKTQRMVKHCSECDIGFCLFLTNDSFYWNPSKMEKKLQCKEFLLYAGDRRARRYAYRDKKNRRVVGKLVKKKTQYKPITLLYPCFFHWEKYPSNDDFRLLICEVRQP